jgi:putative aminopeptidase FrvX
VNRYNSKQLFVLIAALTLSVATLSAQVNEDTAKNGQIILSFLQPEKIQARLDQYKGDDTKREAALRRMFLDAGCAEANLSEQRVPDRKQPNVICMMPGRGVETIVVGAHFDHAEIGQGIVDNWSGASLLPSLLESLKGVPRNHTFIFVGFTGEEDGLRGSQFYVKELPAEQMAKVVAMVNMDSLGLGSTLVWMNRSDPVLVKALNLSAQALKLPLAVMNVDGFGESDEESFIQKKICTVTVHSVTTATARVLHNVADNPSAIPFSDYYGTYRLLAGYLALLDYLPTAQGRVCKVAPLTN